MKASMKKITSGYYLGEYAVNIDPEARRAIRFCCGFNSDLRVKITGNQSIDAIQDFIEKNRAGIFGVEMAVPVPDTRTQNEEFWAFERGFRQAAAIVAGV